MFRFQFNLWSMLIAISPLFAGERWQVRFLNGDTLPEITLQRLQQGNLLMTLDGAETPIEVPARFVGTLTRLSPPPAAPAPPRLRVNLWNGNRLHGEMISLDGEHLHLQSTWGQALALPLEIIEGFEPLPPAPRGMPLDLFQLSGWQATGGGLQVETPSGLQFHPQTDFFRRFHAFPDRFHLQAALRFHTGFPQTTLVLFGRNASDRGSRTLSLNLQMNQMTVIFQDGRNPQNLLQLPTGFPQDEVIHLELIGDLPRGEFLIRFNEDPFVRFEVPRLAAPHKVTPSAGIFVHQNPMDLLDFRISPWTGPLPRLQMLPENQTPWMALFRNGDFLQLQSLRGHENTLHLIPTAGNAFDLPLHTVYRMRQGRASPPPQRRSARDVSVFIEPTGDRITLAMTELDAGKLTGILDGCPTRLEIPLNRIQRLHLNIHQPHRFDFSAPVLQPSLHPR